MSMLAASLGKQGGRRYGQTGLGSALTRWVRSRGAVVAAVFNPVWAKNRNRVLGPTATQPIQK